MPQASVSKGSAPTPLMPSTTTRISGTIARAVPASASIGLVTPVEVSLWVSRMAVGGRPSATIDSRTARTSSGRAAVPHSTSSRVTSAPYVVAIFAKRSPKAPTLTARTGSPGERWLTMAASRPPVPDAVRMQTSCSVRMAALEAARDAGEERTELGAAMVDHLPPARRADAVGQGGRAWDMQAGRHGAHGSGLRVADGSAGRAGGGGAMVPRDGARGPRDARSRGRGPRLDACPDDAPTQPPRPACHCRRPASTTAPRWRRACDRVTSPSSSARSPSSASAARCAGWSSTAGSPRWSSGGRPAPARRRWPDCWPRRSGRATRRSRRS